VPKQIDGVPVYCAHVRVEDIERVIPNPRNPNTHNDRQIELLANIIKAQGWRAPITVSTRSGFIVRGHGRLMAARKLGLSHVPVDYQDYANEAEEWADLIADNRIAELAEWDLPALKDILEEIDTGAIDMDLTGFDADDLEKLMTQFRGNVEEDSFNVDKATEEIDEPVTKPGDLWILGRHRLACGDSTKAETFSLLMDGKLANLVVTDPPYNVNYEGTAGKIKNDNMADQKFYQFLLEAFTLTEKAMAKDASIYVFHADTEGLNFRRAFDAAGFYLSGTCIWKKQSLVLGRSPYQWQHEPILFGWKKTGKHAWYSDRKQTTIWEFDKPRKNADHPTMKPVPLCAKAIENSSKAGDIVLDIFGGSGSTLIACEQLNRTCYMMELDPIYCDVIIRRWENFTGKKAVMAE
jgi:DNA modification methylase